jgi:hypothetical protein
MAPTAWKQRWKTGQKPRPPAASHPTCTAVRTRCRTASRPNRGVTSSIVPTTATNRRWQRRVTRVPGRVSRSPRRASIATLISRQRVVPVGVPGCGRNGTMPPAAPIPSGSAASSAATDAAGGNAPAAHPANSSASGALTRCPTGWPHVQTVPAANDTPVNCCSQRHAVSYGTTTATRQPLQCTAAPVRWCGNTPNA